MTRFFVANSECRVYAYEPGFPGNNRSYTGTGWRGYVAANVRMLSWLSVNAKFGATWQATANCDAGLSLSFRY